MFTLPSDIQKLMCDFLGLRDINVLYCLSKSSIEMFKVLTEHTNFTINAKDVLTDEQIEWFESRNIKVNLFKEVVINSWPTHWYTNGYLDGPDDDSPAVEYVNGAQEYYKKGIRHRLNGPAKIFSSGTEEWWENGLRHRLNGPAIIQKSDGVVDVEEWWENGLRHRLNGPAAIYTGLCQHWYKNGLRHRLDGPATVFDTGGEEWFENDLCHRLDGPAITKSNGEVEYWEYGVQIL